MSELKTPEAIAAAKLDGLPNTRGPAVVPRLALHTNEKGDTLSESLDKKQVCLTAS